MSQHDNKQKLFENFSWFSVHQIFFNRRYVRKLTTPNKQRPQQVEANVLPEGCWIKPPNCVVSPEAHASAAAYPDQNGLGQRERVGSIVEIQD